MENPSQYFKGMKACNDGKPHLINQHPDWDTGYSDQYHLEQQLTGQQLENEHVYQRRISTNTVSA